MFKRVLTLLINKGEMMKHLFLFALFFLTALLAACDTPTRDAATMLESEAFSGVTLHLNPWASNASDSNDGSEVAPLKSIQGAFEKMIPIKESGQNVRILFYPGVYRDILVGGESRPFWRIPDNNAWLIFAAKEKGAAIISGSDVWTNWTNEGNGLWSKAWTYNWGATGTGNSYFSSGPPVSELAARRELIFVNGERLNQVLNKSALKDNTFQVDEAGNKLTLKLRASLNPNSATTEVATREQLSYIWNRDNIMIRGLVFQHAANQFPQAAVAFQEGQGRACRNIRVVDTTIRYNGQVGLENYCDDTIMRRNQVNDNGFGGILGGSAKNWLLEDNQTNRNAWRSWAGGYKGWATAGLKVGFVDGFTVRWHESKYNYAEGFWVDTNNTTVTLEDSTISHNLWNGVFLEASAGPFMVKNTLICNNGLADLVLSAVAKVTLENNRILSNAPVNTELPAPSVAVFYSELRRKEPQIGEFPMRDITFTNNKIVSTGERNLTGSWVYYKLDDPADDEMQADYEALVRTLRSSGNTYYSPLAKPFGWVDTAKGYAEDYDFATWKTLTKQDGGSSFSNPNFTCPK
jgi:Right handed beta helix region